MKLEEALLERSGNNCELCKSDKSLSLYEVPGSDGRNEDTCILICEKCLAQIDKKEELDSDHWMVLSETMWSEVPGVQVVAWRMLNRLRSLSWAVESLDMLYLEEGNLEWAKSTFDHEDDGNVQLHKDSNGVTLQTGDTIVLTRSLDVKGSSLNAKMGTVVKNIRLVEENVEQIEGRIEGQTIVILTKYVRKQGK